MKTIFFLFATCLILVLLLPSCSDPFDFSKMNKISSTVEVSPNVAIPVGAFSMTFKDLLKEKKDTIVYQSDKSIKVIFRKDSVFGFEMSKFFTMPAMDIPTSSYSFEVGKLDVEDYQFGQTILASSLGAYPSGTLNSPSLSFPNLSNITTTSSTSTVPFDFVHLSSGKVSLKLTNHFPLAMQSGLTVELADITGSIGFFYFTAIPAGTSQTQELSLAGKTVYSSGLKVNIKNLTLQGGTGTFNANSDGMQLDFSTTGLKADNGSMVLSRKTLADESHEINLATTDYELFLVKFKTGQLQFHYNSSISADVNTVFSFPDLTKNGIPFSQSMTFSNTNSKYVSEYMDFADGRLDLTKGSSKSYNTIRVNYKVSSTNPTKYITFSEHDKITFDVSFVNPKISYLRGYLGKQIYTFEPTETETGINFFKELDGGFTLTNPSVKLSILNSVGVPVSANLSLKGISKNDKVSSLDKTVTITVPADQEPVSETTTEVVFNKDNSTIVDMLSYAPKKITYSGTVTANPANDHTLVNYISENSKVQMGVQLDLPIELKTSNLLIVDTIELGDNDMKEFNKQYKNISDATAALHVFASNGFPFGMELIFVPINTNTHQTFSTINAQLIESAEIDDNGIVTKAKASSTKVELTHEDITNISKANRLIATLRIKTANEGTVPVTMHYDYNLNVKIGFSAYAKGKATID